MGVEGEDCCEKAGILRVSLTSKKLTSEEYELTVGRIKHSHCGNCAEIGMKILKLL